MKIKQKINFKINLTIPNLQPHETPSSGLRRKITYFGAKILPSQNNTIWWWSLPGAAWRVRGCCVVIVDDLKEFRGLAPEEKQHILHSCAGNPLKPEELKL